MGGGGSKSQTVGYRYYMSLLMGVSRGPLDEIVQIKVGDVNAWPVADGATSLFRPRFSGWLPAGKEVTTVAQGPNDTATALFEDGTSMTVAQVHALTVTNGANVDISASQIFGGERKEGGVEGALRVLMGYAMQVVPDYIKAALGGRVPDYRGVTTMFFDGLICAINPYPKPWKFRVRRTTSGWDGAVWQPELAAIWMRGGTIKAMNPMHIIYECLTNRDWGRGYPREWLSDARLTQIAQVLYNEGFGLCLRWSRSGELGEFIQMVINHVGGSLYVDRTTGLISMDLLRGNYDSEQLPLFTYTSGLLSIETAETSSQEDLVNEVIVTWKDPIRDKDRQVRVHNLASLQSMDGGKNSTKTDYTGVPAADLAARLAQRDLKAGATSLKRFKVVLDRRAWRIKPGDVFRVAAPEKDVYNVILRAGKVSSGTNTDGRITVEAVLDVFGLPSSSFIAPPIVEWVPPSREPMPVARSVVREANYRDLIMTIGPGDVQTMPVDASAVVTMAAKPTALSQAYNLATRVTGENFRQRGSGTFLPCARVAQAVGVSHTILTYSDGIDMGLVRVGIAVQMGSEIVSLLDIDPVASTITVARGCADTLPETHDVGTSLFFMIDEPGTDGREYARFETAEVKILPYTSSSQLEQARAPVVPVDIAGRQGRPLPPGNMRVNGRPLIGFADNGSVTTSGDIVLTWAHRDRRLIQDRLIDTNAVSIGPEAGTTYSVRVYASAAATQPVRAVTGIVGTTWTYTTAMISADSTGNGAWYEVESVRDGLPSFQHYRFSVARTG